MLALEPSVNMLYHDVCKPKSEPCRIDGESKIMLDLNDLHQTFDLALTPRQTEGYSLDKIPCCWILRLGKSNSYVKMNDTAVLIWSLCEGELTVGDIIGALIEEYPDVPDIEKDIQRTLDSLLEEGVIEINA